LTVDERVGHAAVPMPPVISIRVQVGGMRWRLTATDRLEVWSGTAHLGTLTGRTLHLLIEHHLLVVEMQGWVVRALQRGAPAARVRRQLRAPPAPFTLDEQARQRARRRTRRRPA
jgi:hypothetical protein